MCYSTTLRKNKHENRIEGRIKRLLKYPEEYTPHYRANGFTHPNLYIIRQEEPDLIVPAKWGFVPQFGMDDIDTFYGKYNTLNAKSETIFTSRTYRESILDKRCLVIVDGFHEPHHHMGVSYPYFCRYPNDEVFCFAGIYSTVDDNNDFFTCSILTTEANEQFAYIHNKKKRMPLILDESYEELWLEDLHEPHIKDVLKEAFTKKEIEAFSISRDLYKKGIDSNTEMAITKVHHDALNPQGGLFD